MAKNFDKRNEKVREYCASLESNHPHWKIEYILEKAAERFFLAPRTITAIVKGEGIYSY